MVGISTLSNWEYQQLNIIPRNSFVVVFKTLNMSLKSPHLSCYSRIKKQLTLSTPPALYAHHLKTSAKLNQLNTGIIQQLLQNKISFLFKFFKMSKIKRYLKKAMNKPNGILYFG